MVSLTQFSLILLRNIFFHNFTEEHFVYQPESSEIAKFDCVAKEKKTLVDANDIVKTDLNHIWNKKT